MAGSKEFSVRPSKMPKEIVGFEHVPKLGVLAARISAADATPPPAAAGVVAKSD